MAASKYEILMWAERIISLKGGPPHAMLDLKETAGESDAQAAFHRIARTAHPDLHRNTLSPDELELVTSAYAAVAGAYMEVRSRTQQTSRIKAIGRDDTPPPNAPAGRPTPAPRPGGTTRTPPAGTPAASPSGDAGAGFADFLGGLSSANAAQQMSPKAIVYYRKFEAALKRGDLKSAVLQIKLAIAADPTSTFLRNALAEVDAELRRTT